MLHGEAKQQLTLWMQRAHEAYVRRQIPRVLNYLHRALDYAEQKGLHQEIAQVCRDLGYVYAREGALERALVFLDQGLAAQGSELPVQAGLLANKAGVLARQGSYRAALALLEECARLIRSRYQDFSTAPGQIIHSYAGVVRMAEDLGKVVDLLDMGINPERLQVEIKGHEPSWLSGEE